jgi:hypothetical protein
MPRKRPKRGRHKVTTRKRPPSPKLNPQQKAFKKRGRKKVSRLQQLFDIPAKKEGKKPAKRG